LSSLAIGGVEARTAASVAARVASRAAPALIGGPLGIALGAALLAYGAYELYQMYNESHSETSEDEPGECTGECQPAAPEIAGQKQDGHVKGTAQNKNREKQGKPTSTFDGDRQEADDLTQEAWQKGAPVQGRPNVKDHDFGRPIGTGPSGGSQTKVRVHQGNDGRIHGHPAGPETPVPSS
jgi:hypothetical protein